MRPRDPPTAARIAISRRRPVARASSRFATLAHAISRTKLTAPASTSSDVRTPRTSTSRTGSTEKALPCGSAFGNFWPELRRRQPAARSAPAGASRRASSARRLEIVPLVRRVGRQLERQPHLGRRRRIPGSRTGRARRRRCRGRRSARPSCRPRSGRESKRVVQSPWLEHHHLGPLGRSSSGENVRPSASGAPKRLEEVRRDVCRTELFREAAAGVVHQPVLNAATSSTTWACWR